MKLLLAAGLVLVLLLAGWGCGGSVGLSPTVPPGGSIPSGAATATPLPVATNTPRPGMPTATLEGKTPVPTGTVVPGVTPTIPATVSPTPGKTSTSGILFAKGNDVWLVDVASQQTRLILPEARDFSWSPDGQSIVFVRGQGLEAEIWLSHRDGSGQRRLTYNSRQDSLPVWSNNGQTIAFTSSTSAFDDAVPWLWRGHSMDQEALAAWAASAEVWLVAPDGSGLRRLAAGFGASWSPEGRRLAFHRRGDGNQAYVLVINAEGRNEWPLAASTSMEGPVSGGLFYGQLAWSPDGRDLVYGTASYAMLSDWGLLRQAATLSKAAVATVGQTGGYFVRVAYSPDGQLLATDFYGSDGRGPVDGLAVFQHGQPSSTNFYNDQLDLSATKVLYVPGAHSPAWSPDGQMLAYVASGSIWRWDRLAQQVTRLVENVDDDGGLSWR